MHSCVYVCMYVCMHACMYVCMYVCMRACMHACMYVCKLCVYACVAGCLSIFICLSEETTPLRVLLMESSSQVKISCVRFMLCVTTLRLVAFFFVTPYPKFQCWECAVSLANSIPLHAASISSANPNSSQH